MKYEILAICALAGALGLHAQTLKSPDGKVCMEFSLTSDGTPNYSITYDGKKLLKASPLGLVADFADLSKGLRLDSIQHGQINDKYTLSRSKQSEVTYCANALTLNYSTPEGYRLGVEARVSDSDVALRYIVPAQKGRASVRVMEEATGFAFPSEATAFLSPQCDPMIGWKRTKPSYEEEYVYDVPMEQKSSYGHGWTFPCLFKVGADGWVLLSETGVDSRYCGSRLSDYDIDRQMYTLKFPMPGENNGNGTAEPAFALPGATPWRTISLGATLRPIVETTAPWNNVSARYATANDYEWGKGTWSWIVWQDNSINLDDQKRYVDLAQAMGFPYVLVDNWWDTNMGQDGIAALVDYARERGVDVWLWYSSSGYWNDIVQGPTGLMDNPIARKQQMRWMRGLGVKGIKVDFFGGDKQETMRLYEQILSDADDHGLMVIFHGCTIPRGWERMYPNYAGSEAVLASENLVFQQHFCDKEAQNAATHPFIRNAIGCMEFGGSFLSRRLARGNNSGTHRRTTDGFELATAVLFQNPIQNFALAPENLLPESEGGAPQVSLDFLRQVPTLWDETRFIDGYPGRYAVLARRSGDKWYVAGVNAETEPITLHLNLPMLTPGQKVNIITDNAKTREPRQQQTVVKKPTDVEVKLITNGGFVIWSD